MNNWSKKNFKEKGLMQGDMVLWMVLLALCFISVITVYSASSNMTYGTSSTEPIYQLLIFQKEKRGR